MMSSDSEQEKNELAIFKLFAQYSHLKIIESTIENKKPPKPDIYCEIEGTGKVAFELTEIIDSKILKNKNLALETKKILYDYSLNILSKQNAEDFNLKYSDALIKVEFKDTLSINKRKNLLITIFSYLLSLEPQYKGKILNQTCNHLKGLDFIEITRSYKNKPRFFVHEFTWYDTPLKDILKNKFRKKYNTCSAIELLAHINYNLDSDEHNNYPESYWNNIVESVNEDFKQSPFQKLWIFDCVTNSVLFEASNPRL